MAVIAYDDLNRLSTVNYGDGETQSYAFDAMGNRLSKTDTMTPQSGSATTNKTVSTYDAANRITGVSTNGGTAKPITSDADGNTLTDASGRSYTWDSSNRMTSCTYNGTTTTFTYGSDGLRRSMTVNGVTTYYGYDGTMLAQEYKVNAQTDQLAPTASYLSGPSGPICRVDETNQTEGYYPAGVTSTAPLARGVTHWYVYDGLGSVIGELDDNNNLTTSCQYDVYGAPRASTRQGGAATSPQGYVGSLGHVTDASTGGLIYMQARYYDPGLGRFVSEDPACNGLNWFVYVNDNPSNLFDRTGRAGEAAGGAVLLWLAVQTLLSVGEQGLGGWRPPAALEHTIAFINDVALEKEIINYAFEQLVNVGKAFSKGEAGEEYKASQYFLGAIGVGAVVAILAVQQLVLLAMTGKSDESDD